MKLPRSGRMKGLGSGNETKGNKLKIATGEISGCETESESEDKTKLRHLLGRFSKWKFWVWLADSPPEESGRTRESIKVPLTPWQLSIKSKNEIKLKLKELVFYATILYGISFNPIE